MLYHAKQFSALSGPIFGSLIAHALEHLASWLHRTLLTFELDLVKFICAVLLLLLFHNYDRLLTFS